MEIENLKKFLIENVPNFANPIVIENQIRGNVKKLVFIYLLISNIAMFSQEYKPLLDYYNEWHLRYCFVDCSTDIYYTNGDTLVDNKSYKILDGYHYISRTFLLREEVAEQKVYLRLVPPGGDSEYLLYDFSLKVGRRSPDVKLDRAWFGQGERIKQRIMQLALEAA